MSVSQVKHRCNFCTRAHDEVERLIAGPEDIFICNFCVDLCTNLLKEEDGEEIRGGQWASI